MQVTEKKEYNKIMQRIHREKERELAALYHESEITGISFSEFKSQHTLSTFEKISIMLSDDELKISKLNVKLSDREILRALKNRDHNP